MFTKLFYQINKKFPVVSFLLIASCLISTIPQFFLNDLYSEITRQSATFHSFYLFTLSAFTHSPEMILPHFFGNLLVFLIFGILCEKLLGARRFAFLSILTFFTTTIVNYIHSDTRILGHGASGIAWGYHVVFIYFLILIFKKQRVIAFKDIYVILGIILMIFDIIGIPIIEVILLKQQFFSNFGQTLHLISMAVVISCIFFWKSDIKQNLDKLLSEVAIKEKSFFKSLPVFGIMFLFLLNIFGTWKAIDITLHENKSLEYRIIEQSNQQVSIIFDNEIESYHRNISSIAYEDSLGSIYFNEKLISPKELEITFNRPIEKSESIKLGYQINWKFYQDVIKIDQVIFEN
ncbi:MAG: rhomboid family intramembrane serine protease [Candidatus Marinimicrobia bacterium]|nr:rhomboid family intramembrane serine protease [Candidatus Neomarinimicrobiota bacterium]